MVSIMPGMLARAPLRTLTSRGFFGSPNFLPVSFSSQAMDSAIFFDRPSGTLPPALMYSTHTSVVMVKPGGTGMPRFAISARLAPLPPSSGF